MTNQTSQLKILSILLQIFCRAVNEGKQETFWKVRAEMDNILAQPDGIAEGYIIPDFEGNLIDDFRDKEKGGKLIPETPYRILVAGLYNVRAERSDNPEFEDMLRARGYNDEDLFYTSHLHSSS